MKKINYSLKVTNVMKNTLPILLSLILTSCSSYNSKFNCNPATGVGCVSMSKTYELIKSGEIERVDIDLKKQKKLKLGK